VIGNAVPPWWSPSGTHAVDEARLHQHLDHESQLEPTRPERVADLRIITGGRGGGQRPPPDRHCRRRRGRLRAGDPGWARQKLGKRGLAPTSSDRPAPLPPLEDAPATRSPPASMDLGLHELDYLSPGALGTGFVKDRRARRLDRARREVQGRAVVGEDDLIVTRARRTAYEHVWWSRSQPETNDFGTPGRARSTRSASTTPDQGGAFHRRRSSPAAGPRCKTERAPRQLKVAIIGAGATGRARRRADTRAPRTGRLRARQHRADRDVRIHLIEAAGILPALPDARCGRRHLLLERPRRRASNVGRQVAAGAAERGAPRRRHHHRGRAGGVGSGVRRPTAPRRHRRARTKPDNQLVCARPCDDSLTKPASRSATAAACPWLGRTGTCRRAPSAHPAGQPSGAQLQRPARRPRARAFRIAISARWCRSASTRRSAT